MRETPESRYPKTREEIISVLKEWNYGITAVGIANELRISIAFVPYALKQMTNAGIVEHGEPLGKLTTYRLKECQKSASLFPDSRARGKRTSSTD